MGTAESDHSVKSCPDGQFLKLCSQMTLVLVYDDEDIPDRLSGKIVKVFDHTAVAFQGKTVKPRTSFIEAVNTECFEVVVKVRVSYSYTMVCVIVLITIVHLQSCNQIGSTPILYNE